MKSLKTALQILLGLIFIFSAYSKLVSYGMIEIILVDQGFFSDRATAGYIVRILIGIEFAIGFCYLLPYNIEKIVIPTSLLLLTFFTIYLIYSGFVLGEKENCGCFGTVVEMSPIESIIKNIVLIILNVVLLKLIKDEKKNYALLTIITIVSIIFVFIVIPVRDVKDFKFEKYTSFIGEGRVDLADGDKLLCIFSLDCDHCQQAAKDLWDLKNRISGIPETYVLFFSEDGISVDSFKTLTNSNFPYHMISEAEFFDLIGTTSPRIYWLNNGKIEKYWDKDFIKNIVLEFKKN